MKNSLIDTETARLREILHPNRKTSLFIINESCFEYGEIIVWLLLINYNLTNVLRERLLLSDKNVDFL